MNARGEYGNRQRYNWNGSAIGAEVHAAKPGVAETVQSGLEKALPFAIPAVIGTVLWVAVSRKFDAEYDRGIRDGKALARGQDPRKFYSR